MRDKNRLDAFYSELCEIHKTYFQDWRFGQLMSNFLGWLYKTKKRDYFFPEEDEMIEHINEYARTHSKWRTG